MIRKPNEDLFKDTTMTFGEHLEELRTCLWRAVVGIVIGFGIGLWFADSVVQYIKRPMESALERFYSDQVLVKFEQELKDGKKLPYTLPEVTALVREQGLLFDIEYVNPRDLTFAQQPQEASQPPEEEPGPTIQPATNGTAKASPAVAGTPPRLQASDLVPVFLWHRVEDDPRIRLIGLAAQDSFMIWLKAGLIVGVVIASPWIFWQIWSFIAAGLYPHEKHYVHVFMPFSIGLFLLGASVAFLFVFDKVLDFLLSFYASMDIDPDQRITDWLSFVLLLPLGFGISFQLPLVMLFMERIGIFDVTAYLEKWRIAVLIIFVISMVFSPGGDPYSMMFMAIPLTFLYFGGILLCKYLPKGRNPFDAAWE
jgi:sec-independent protein translocase protein TatC